MLYQTKIKQDNEKQITYKLNTATYEYIHMEIIRHLKTYGVKVTQRQRKVDKTNFPVERQLDIAVEKNSAKPAL